MAVLAQVVRVLVQLAFAALLARILKPDDFGLVAMAASVMAFIGLFADLGLSAATVQQKEISHSIVNALFYLNLAISIPVTGAMIAAAPLAGGFFGDDRIGPVIIAMALSLPVAAAGAQHGALLQRSMRWGPLQWTPIVAQLIGGSVAILLALQAQVGYWALVAQSWIAVLVTTLSMWCFCRWRPDFRPAFDDVRAALRFGLNLTGFQLVNYFHRQLDNVLVGKRWGAAELGYYSRAYQLLTLPLALVNGPAGSALVPALSRLQDDPERWRRAFLKAFSAVTLLSSGIAAVMVAAAEPVVLLIYGPGWEAAARIFFLLAISIFVSAPMYMMGWIYNSLGQTGRAFRWSLMVTPVYVASFLAGLPFGAAGVAACYSIAACLAAIPCMAFACRSAPLEVSQLLRASLPSVALGALIGTGLAALPLPQMSLLARLAASVSLASILYLAGATLILWADPAQAPLKAELRRRLLLARPIRATSPCPE